MSTLARHGLRSTIATYLHLVFGGLVRVTGSGMGCGDHWPKCNGSWVPPFTDVTVMIEYTHRLLAALVFLLIAWFAFAAWQRRAQPGVGGRGGVLRAATTAFLLVIAVALLGLVTVKLGNRPVATLAHWTLAMGLLAVVVAATVRAGGLGGGRARSQGGPRRTVNSLAAGVALAFAAVVLGGLVAKLPGASVACPNLPLCGAIPSGIPVGYARLHITHRVIAYLLFFHVLAVTLALSRRGGEAQPVRVASKSAASLVVLQVVIGAVMILSMLRPALRSLHEAIGVAVWMTMFLATYLAHVAYVARRKSESGVPSSG